MFSHPFIAKAVLLFAAGASAVQKGRLTQCSAVTNAPIDGSNFGTQINMVIDQIAIESISSICDNFDRFISNPDNGYGGFQINCNHDDAHRLIAMGINVPQSKQQDPNSAFNNVMDDFQGILQGEVQRSAVNAFGSDCFILDPTVNNLKRDDSISVRQHPRDLARRKDFPLGRGGSLQFGPSKLLVLAARTAHKGLIRNLPDPVAFKQNLDGIAQQLGTTGRTISAKAQEIVSGVDLFVSYDTGNQIEGFPQIAMGPDDWKSFLGKAVDTLAGLNNLQDTLTVVLVNDGDITKKVAAVVDVCLVPTTAITLT